MALVEQQHEATRLALDPIKNRLGRREPLDRFTEGGHIIEELRAQMSEVANYRRQAVRDMHSQGFSLTEIADMVGLTKARIKQIGDL